MRRRWLVVTEWITPFSIVTGSRPGGYFEYFRWRWQARWAVAAYRYSPVFGAPAYPSNPRIVGRVTEKRV